jgi:hypothetical protein
MDVKYYGKKKCKHVLKLTNHESFFSHVTW